MKHAFLVPYSFVLMNWAAVVSLYRFIRQGNNIGYDIWTTHFHPPNHPAPQHPGEDKRLWFSAKQLN
ncbi:MAG: hypothetical protein HY648_00470 [Acidobacteria bacterium]|nr:hypothetical protein [Acidobacteriota bacterium]